MKGFLPIPHFSLFPLLAKAMLNCNNEDDDEVELFTNTVVELYWKHLRSFWGNLPNRLRWPLTFFSKLKYLARDLTKARLLHSVNPYLKHAKPRRLRQPNVKQSTIPEFMPKPKKGEKPPKDSRENATESWTPHKDASRKPTYIKNKGVSFKIIEDQFKKPTPGKTPSKGTPTSSTPKKPTTSTPKPKRYLKFEPWQKEKERILNLTKLEKRKEICKDFVELANIPTWSEQCKSMNIEKLTDIRTMLFEDFKKNDMDLSSYVSLYQGDITKLEIDVIVNAANNELKPGGGVDGQIVKAAGNLLVEENKRHGGCRTGEAVISCGYKLPARYVISTVGPKDKNEADLFRSYLNSLEMMKANGSTTIAFPCIGTGIYAFPRPQACRIALQAVRKFLESNYRHVERVIFVMFKETDTSIYKERMIWMFPCVEAKVEFNRIFVNNTGTSCWLNSCVHLILCGMDHVNHHFTSEMGLELQRLSSKTGELNSDGILAAISQVCSQYFFLAFMN